MAQPVDSVFGMPPIPRPYWRRSPIFYAIDAIEFLLEIAVSRLFRFHTFHYAIVHDTDRSLEDVESNGETLQTSTSHTVML